MKTITRAELKDSSTWPSGTFGVVNDDGKISMVVSRQEFAIPLCDGEDCAVRAERDELRKLVHALWDGCEPHTEAGKVAQAKAKKLLSKWVDERRGR